MKNNPLTRWLCGALTDHAGRFASNWADGGRICLCGSYVRFPDEIMDSDIYERRQRARKKAIEEEEG